MSLLTDIATGGLSTLVDSVAKSAGELFTSDAERLAAENDAKRIDASLEIAHLADTDSARKHDASVQESEHASFLAKNVAYWIDLFIVSATFGLAYILIFKPIPVDNKELLYTMFGSLLTLCMTVVNFHRGSSMRSQSKDATIQKLSGK